MRLLPTIFPRHAIYHVPPRMNVRLYDVYKFESVLLQQKINGKRKAGPKKRVSRAMNVLCGVRGDA